MKKINQTLYALGTCFALTQAAQAQEITPDKDLVQDTIVVLLENSDKVFFIGNYMRDMTAYDKADSLKVLFLNDWKKSLETKQLTGDETHVYYFVHNTGKRRLKAENTDYSDRDVNPAAEIKRLDLDLPAYKYEWYDVGTGYRFEVYAADPQKLREGLEKVSLDLAIKQAGKTRREKRRYYKTEVSTDENGYKVLNRFNNRKDEIGIYPMLGPGLMGSTLAPAAVIEILVKRTDKYGIGRFTLGANVRSYSIFNIQTDQGQGMGGFVFYNAQVQFNSSATRKESWFGMHGGIMHVYGPNLLQKDWNFGFSFYQGGHIHYYIDLIGYRKRLNTVGFTVAFSF